MKYRVSHVEAFRQWEQDDDADIESLLRRIRGDEPPSEKMLAGTALHKALELAQDDGEVSELQADGYTFLFAGDFKIALTHVRELRAHKTYMADGRPIVISGQVDQIEGKRIDDHKTTGRFDPERYLDGCQWRLYLDIFNADRFRWNVLEMEETDEPGVWRVFNQHTLEQYRYPELPADCAGLVTRFARFVRDYIESPTMHPTTSQSIAAEVGVTI